MLSFEQIKELVELVARHGLAGLELERSGFKLSIAARQAGQQAPPSGDAPAALPLLSRPEGPADQPAPAGGPGVGAGTGNAGAAAVTAGPPPGAHVLTSPIVGTFYAAPAPDAEPFVRVGDRVRQGQVLCIVEAMKLMNEIESDTDGTIVEVYPRNAQPVEFGEPLFAIRAG
jgi:acetyl-CoA carboxylase biotin carboxyl carrier protein